MFAALSGAAGYLVGIIAAVAFITVGLALLPDGASHPLPQGVIDATTTLYSWLWSFNNIFPVDVLVQVVGYAVLISIITGIVWPIMFWIIKVVTGAGE